MAEPKKKRTWIYVVVGILVSFFVIGIVLIGSAVFYVRRHVSTQVVAADVAGTEFDRTRARFAGQVPLIEMRGEHDAIVHRRTAVSHVELQTLHVLAFDSRSEKLVRVNIPFWVVRMMPSGRVRLGTNEGLDFESERINLTVDDLQAAGPGLVIDGLSSRGDTRILVWTD